MRGYNWGNGTVRCGFCGNHGHNITSCTEVDRVAKNTLKKIETNPEYTPDWKEGKSLRELKKREERRAKQRTTVRKKPTCSFCGSRHHKRNKCDELKKFKKRVSIANKNWRTSFVKHMGDSGYGIGSLVSLPIAMIDYWAGQGDTTAIVVGYNSAKLNMFCLLMGNGGEYYSEPSIEMLCDGKVINCQINRLFGDLNEGIVGTRYSWNHYTVKSIAASTTDLPEEFYTIEGDEALEWFFSKISMKQKIWFHIDKLVRRWLR